MSHQTGIRANDALKKFFGQCKNGKTRAFKVSIEDESLSLAGQKKCGKSWEEDFDSSIVSLISEEQPSYILYRLDTKNSSGYDWLLICWSPDTASVRQKMLYASTKATLKQEFGSGDIKDELHATSLDEVTLKGYKKHKEDLKAPAPLTNREEEMKELLKAERENISDVGIDTKHESLGKLVFPIDESAKAAINDYKRSVIDYVQFKIDLMEEKIYLVDACVLSTSELRRKIPQEYPRYHLFRFKHTHEGDYMETNVFIYSMPGFSCSIKERMVYSSCKSLMLSTIAAQDVEVEKKLEVDTDDDVTEAFLADQVHPKVNLHQPKFAKPQGPPNRGARRITKPKD